MGGSFFYLPKFLLSETVSQIFTDFFLFQRIDF